MPRPASTPRLATIDPDALGREISDRMRDHVARAGLSCGLGTHESGPSDIAHTVADLTRYARDGARLDADVQEYLVRLIPLWSAPLGDAPTPLDVADDLDADEPLGVVMLAALGREAISLDQRVPARQLAALAGIDVQSLRRLAAQGELKMRDGEVAAGEAGRWLSGRGVTGFAG